MVARRTLTPTLGAELKKFKTAAQATNTRPFGQKIMGQDAALEVYDNSGNLAVRIAPTGSFFTGTIDITSAGSSIRAYNGDGVLTLDLNGTTNVIVGMIRTAPVGNAQVVVQPAGSAWNGKDLAVWFTPDGSTPTTGGENGRQAGMWMSTVPSIGTSVPVNIRGQSGAGARLWGDLTLFPTGGSTTAVIDASSGDSIDVTAKTVSLKATNGRVYLNPTGAVRMSTLGSGGPYVWTSSSPANVYMDGDGVIWRSTSSRRYKTAIADFTPSPDWLDIPVVEWTDKAALAAAAEVPADAPRPLTWEQQAALDAAAVRHIGTLAEDAQAAAPRQIVRDHAGRVEGYAYERDGAVLRHFVRGHRDRLADHERRLRAIEAALTAREDQTPIE